ncbi:MAG: ATP-binding protein [Terriglobia bacterium]|jgi:signal transduction histidine kinase
MRLSLKAKLTALITLLVLLVVVATSTVYISNLTRQALLEVQTKGEYVANEVYHQAGAVLAQSRMPEGENPQDFQALRSFVQTRLASDPGLKSLMESAVGYSPVVDYVAITDTNLVALVHSNSEEVGHHLTPAPRYSQLMRAGMLRQLRAVYGPPQVYEVILPLALGSRPLGDVRVGVSTVLLRDEISPNLRAALLLSLMAIVFATLSAEVVSFRVLRPLENISQSVDLLARGEFSVPITLQRRDEWGILSSKLHLLGEQMRGEKAAFVRLQENLDHLFSNLSDGLLLFDQQDRLVLATPAAEHFLGSTVQTPAQRPALEVFSQATPLHQLLREAFQTRQSLLWKTLELPGEHSTRIAVNAQFVGEGAQRVGCLVTLRDTGSRAEIQDQIDTTTKLAAIGRLMSGVAHEVKNPLNAMVLQLEVLKARLGEDGDKVQPQVEILAEEIRRLDRVVKTFLDFTRPVEIHPVDAEVTPLVREVFALAEPQARKNNVQLIFADGGATPPVHVDRDLIKQALLNLVLNGCQAMPQGGELTLTAHAIPKGGELNTTPHAVPHAVELEIRDTGVGIPPDAQKRIFSLFYTTKPGGTGVGLAMAFRVVQLHNGTIDFTSEVNRGTTFRVTLPASAQQDSQQA